MYPSHGHDFHACSVTVMLAAKAGMLEANAATASLRAQITFRISNSSFFAVGRAKDGIIARDEMCGRHRLANARSEIAFENKAVFQYSSIAS
ncbi:hypothetical protein AM571_CH02649 [Rhizobium etli 8C-3]|uniref:Uncharacterized protein n=1 Tax=Rhizobium etli 8C-3 TaxID=538025 RepID=A0A1L5P5M9_RHIET|nr:hypothetical protein AM571_CH02649 [Rhizobium etli 8C-3]